MSLQDSSDRSNPVFRKTYSCFLQSRHVENDANGGPPRSSNGFRGWESFVLCSVGPMKQRRLCLFLFLQPPNDKHHDQCGTSLVLGPFLLEICQKGLSDAPVNLPSASGAELEDEELRLTDAVPGTDIRGRGKGGTEVDWDIRRLK